MTENKNISIIVPVLNGERLIGRCLESLNRLNFQKEHLEVIVVDNGSTDKTLEIVQNFKIIKDMDVKLYIQSIMSSYAARNLGVKNARGEIIVFIDADCAADKDWLINIIRPFSDKTVGGVAGEILPDTGNSIVERYTTDSEILSQKRKFNSGFLPYAQTANAAYRKELFYEIGYFDEVISGGDADFSWRMQLDTGYKIVYEKDAIVFHKHRTNLRGLFKQTFKHGYGYELLKNKYTKGIRKKNGTGNENENIKGNNNGKNTKSNYRIIKLMVNYLKQKDGILILPAIINISGFNLGKLYAKFLLLTHKNQKC